MSQWVDRRMALLRQLAGLIVLLGCAAPAFAQGYVNFESGQVRPLALSPDGTRLFAVNTPDNRLEIFTVGGGTLTPAGSVPVGLEPVAVAARTDSEVWVVNHLSDSISVVDVGSTPPRVIRTLQSCDEPRDIVFAGPGGNRAFVTAARRGQNCALSADLTTSGTPRAVVQVYDATSLGNGLNGAQVTTLALFGDTPRALARSADGNTVYAAVFQSGNQTTTLNEGWVCDGGADAPPCLVSGRTAPGGLPWPNTNFQNIAEPENGLIVRFNNGNSRWEDQLGRNWSDLVRFQLPDLDVFAIDAAAPTPVQTASVAHVGTVLFNMAVNPINGKVYVTNTEARNEVRFEGPGLFAGTAGATVQGHLHEARITVLDGGTPLPRHLNKHIDYLNDRPAPPGVKEHSLATPLGMAVSSDGTTLYVAAFGSSKIGVFDTAALEDDSFVPNSASHIAVSGGGPTGLVLDEANDRLYALTRFDDSIAIIDTATRAEVGKRSLHTPEPAPIVDGRPLLYDAHFTSSNGEASCSSCHVFGDFDSLAWDLGNPDEVVINNPLPVRIPAILGTFEDFHPLKGPMTTQSLRGMANHGSMHWRGDRTAGNDPGGDSGDENGAFLKFNPAFEGLVGRDAPLTPAEMQEFADFILTVTYPPNPIRRLDGVLSGQQAAGQALYNGRITDALFNCNGCHTLDANAGFFGSDGATTFEGETQMFKVPHLRNVYQKVGMFGSPGVANAGPQIRGFGILHDGSVDTVFNFLGASVFSLTNAEQRQLEQFVFAFDSNLKPSVGQQTTITSTTNVNVNDRVTLLEQRDDLGECDVIVKAAIAGVARGAYRLADGTFQWDRVGEAPISDADLRLLAATPGQELTFTCVPPGAGQRLGVDRDFDGYFDRDELDFGTDPADAESFPGSDAVPVRAEKLLLRDDASAPIDPDKSTITFKSSRYQGQESGVVVPAFDSSSDPSVGGATLRIHRGDGGGAVLLSLPAAGWTRVGSATKPGYKYRDKDRINGPIRSITLRNGKLVIKGKGAQLFQLDAAPQGSVVVRLDLGDVDLCTVSPAGNYDTFEKFDGAKHTPAPPSCPGIPF
ncbi:MAG: YncE family protein [Deltaproteobacteria bacterium]|nr:YncE family protein [Deltaproteobacteria bacterium]